MWERLRRRDCRGTKAPPTFWWNWIVPSTAPRMTTAQSADAEPCSPQSSVGLQALEKVNRTGRFKAAARPRSAQERKHRRDQQLVTANEKTQEEKHQGAKIEARSARRNHSSFSTPYVAPAAAGRATTTNQKPFRNRGCSVRTMSRNRRRTRLRTTAPPIRFEVTKPTRKNFSSFCGSTPNRSARPRCVVPSFLTRVNSTGRTRRFVLGNDKSGESEVGGMAPSP
jgi:hypothetical protein